MSGFTPQGFAALFDAAVDGIIIIDDLGRILNFNHAAEKMFGYSVGEVIGQNVSMLMPAPYNMEHDNYLKAYKETNTAKVIGIGRNVEARRKDSSIFPIDLSVGEYVDAGNRYFVGIIRDLSEQVKKEKEMIRASGIAHELNQPLTAISSYVQACRRRLDSGSLDQDKMRELLVKADEQAQRAGKIIRRVRAMVQAHDKVEEVVDINALVLEVIDFAEVDAVQRGIAIEADLSGEACMVVIDSVQIQQVILNLLRNAIDAIVNAHTEIKRIVVNASAVDQTSEVEISVRDFSAGIPASVKENLFDAFVTTKNSGTGMGLSISRSIVHAHGGKIWAEDLQPGTRFCFTLPLDR